ncbi:MAG: HAMP domain-containing protein [bacterium]|nr:HAMP domain-containing protein [bacterium]
MNRRSIKFVNPRLQTRLVLFCLLFTVTALLLQGVATIYSVHRIAATLPEDEGVHLLDAMPRMVVTNLIVTFLALAPIVASLGVLLSHRVVGPLRNFENAFKAIANGEAPREVHLRKNDELKELATHFNAALEAIWSRQSADILKVDEPPGPYPQSETLSGPVPDFSPQDPRPESHAHDVDRAACCEPRS